MLTDKTNIKPAVKPIRDEINIDEPTTSKTATEREARLADIIGKPVITSVIDLPSIIENIPMMVIRPEEKIIDTPVEKEPIDDLTLLDKIMKQIEDNVIDEVPISNNDTDMTLTKETE